MLWCLIFLKLLLTEVTATSHILRRAQQVVVEPNGQAAMSANSSEAAVTLHRVQSCDDRPAECHYRKDNEEKRIAVYTYVTGAYEEVRDFNVPCVPPGVDAFFLIDEATRKQAKAENLELYRKHGWCLPGRCVFAARRKTTGEIMAVKEMLLDRAGRTKEERGDRLVRLTRELRLCEQLEDPYIVSYYGHEFVMGAQGGPEKLHLFLEYCSGGSLAAQLRTYGPVSEELKYTQQLVSGLVYLHSRSPPVVHRDLKCANLLLTHSGDVKIADFGCSKWVQPGESMLENSVAGSIFWMAPELFRGHGKLTTSSDIWSLGCCVLEMATGSAPWAERRFDNILQACHVIANTEELPTIPVELSTKAAGLIRSCLKRNPPDRPTAQELNKSYKKSLSLCA
eukprot:s226_g27.t1